mgnify:CR=1 FL=1
MRRVDSGCSWGRHIAAAPCFHPAMDDAMAPPEPEDLPDDPAALKALLRAARSEKDDLAEEVARLRAIVAVFQRAAFGRRSERLDPDQLELALEEASQEIAEDRAGQNASDATRKASRSERRRVNRGSPPAHLPRVEIVVEPKSADCPCCGGALHRIGEGEPSSRHRSEADGERAPARRDPGPVPGAGDAPAQIRLPRLRRGRRAGAGARTAGSWRSADRGHGRA